MEYKELALKAIKDCEGYRNGDLIDKLDFPELCVLYFEKVLPAEKEMEVLVKSHDTYRRWANDYAKNYLGDTHEYKYNKLADEELEKMEVIAKELEEYINNKQGE